MNDLNEIIRKETLNKIIEMESEHYQYPETICFFDMVLILLFIIISFILIVFCMCGVIV